MALPHIVVVSVVGLCTLEVQVQEGVVSARCVERSAWELAARPQEYAAWKMEMQREGLAGEKDEDMTLAPNENVAVVRLAAMEAESFLALDDDLAEWYAADSRHSGPGDLA